MLHSSACKFICIVTLSYNQLLTNKLVLILGLCVQCMASVQFESFIVRTCSFLKILGQLRRTPGEHLSMPPISTRSKSAKRKLSHEIQSTDLKQTTSESKLTTLSESGTLTNSDFELDTHVQDNPSHPKRVKYQ